MKILVIGGMHGNETLGIELAKRLKASPIIDVDSIIANPLAVDRSVRFVGQDLNRSFPGDKLSAIYESKRANELVDIAIGYDIVFDFHNTYCPDNDCCFVGESANQILFDIAGLFNLNRVIIADYDCINKYCNNCISIEISMSSQLNSVDYWYQKIAELVNMSNIPISNQIKKYRFVKRLSLEARDNFKLDSYNLRAFNKIDDELASKLGVESPAYPIFINDKFTPYNYGGIIEFY